MSKVVLGPARPDQPEQPDANAPRPRRGRPPTGRRISLSASGALEEQECRGCRHWRPFVSQWGHCGCEMVRRHVDGEAPLVTRGSFACRFFSASAAGSRKVRDVDFGEQIQPRAIEAVD